MLHMPKLSALSARLWLEDEERLPANWLAYVLAPHNAFLHLIELYITIRRREPRRRLLEVSLLPVFERFPALQHLVLEAPDVCSPDLESLSAGSPSLRTVCFKHCDAFSRAFLERLGEELSSARDDASPFEKMIIQNMTDIDEQRVPEGTLK